LAGIYAQSDMSGASSDVKERDDNLVYGPPHQMLAVLPLYSKTLVPKELRDLYNYTSLIADLYPAGVVVEPDFKRRDDEYTAIVPNLDMFRIIFELQEMGDELDPSFWHRYGYDSRKVYAPPDTIVWYLRGAEAAIYINSYNAMEARKRELANIGGPIGRDKTKYNVPVSRGQEGGLVAGSAMPSNYRIDNRGEAGPSRRRPDTKVEGSCPRKTSKPLVGAARRPHITAVVEERPGRGPVREEQKREQWKGQEMLM